MLQSKKLILRKYRTIKHRVKHYKVNDVVRIRHRGGCDVYKINGLTPKYVYLIDLHRHTNHYIKRTGITRRLSIKKYPELYI